VPAGHSMVSHTDSQTDASSGRQLALTTGITDALLLLTTFVTFISVMKKRNRSFL